MSYLRLMPLLAVSLFVALPNTVRAAGTPASQQTFQHLYDAADRAAEKKDAQGVIALYAPSVEAVQKDGTVKGYSDLLSAAQQMFMLATSLTSHTSITSFTAHGDAVSIVQKGTMKITVADPTGQGLKPMVIENTSTTKDEWRKGAAGWKIVKEVVTAENMTANGQPVGSIIGGGAPGIGGGDGMGGSTIPTDPE